jgi:hypothetical protein
VVVAAGLQASSAVLHVFLHIRAVASAAPLARGARVVGGAARNARRRGRVADAACWAVLVSDTADAQMSGKAADELVRAVRVIGATGHTRAVRGAVLAVGALV